MLVPSHDLIAVLQLSEDHSIKKAKSGKIGAISKPTVEKVRKTMRRRTLITSIFALAAGAAITGTLVDSCQDKEKTLNPGRLH